MTIFKRLLGAVLTCVLLLTSLACVSNQAVQDAIKKSTQLPPPAPVQRPLDSMLSEFGIMVGPYVTAATGERSIPIEIDFIANEVVDKELPTDLGQYARNVIEKIGDPFETYRTWPAIANTARPAGGTLALLPSDRPKPPRPAYRLVGSLLRASERLAKHREGRADGQFGGGHTQWDTEITGDHTRTLTSLTVALTLEDPSGVAVHGATAVYRIEVEKSELNRSVSVYVGGSGIGGGSKLTTTQDWGDAFYDATAIAVVHLLGNALLVPYYRCSPLFAMDQGLDQRVRDALLRYTRTELEQYVKRYLFVAGYPIDMHGPDLTDADRGIMATGMQKLSLDFSDRTSLVEFAMRLWRTLDYDKAAKRVADRLAESAQIQREQIQQAARAHTEDAGPRAESIGPVQFGWPASVRAVVLDLSRVVDADLRVKLLGSLRGCSGCDEIRIDQRRSLVGIRMSSASAELQRALRSSSLPVEYVWTDTRQLVLVVVPVPTSKATMAVRQN